MSLRARRILRIALSRLAFVDQRRLSYILDPVGPAMATDQRAVAPVAYELCTPFYYRPFVHAPDPASRELGDSRQHRLSRGYL